MAFWTTVAPYAGMAAGSYFGPVGMAAGGALGGALAGEAKRQEALQRQQRTANAAAEAGRVSWARRGGPGQIPGIQWAGAEDLNAPLTGSVATGLQGYMLGRSMEKDGGWDWGKGSSESTPLQGAQSYNEPMFEAGRYDQMQGVMDTTPVDWSRLRNRTAPNFYA